MLLNFEITNWACFKSPASFTMQATGEQRNKETLIDIGTPARPMRILPVAAIYGNNAAGKSQLVLAMAFLRSLVVGEYKNPLAHLQPFRFDDATARAPVTFKIQLLAETKAYELEIVIAGNGILKERLSVFNSRLTQSTPLYVREGNRLVESNLADSAYGNLYKSRDIAPSSLFLSMAVEGGVEDGRLRTVVSWFANTLTIILPSSSYMPAENFTGDSEIARRTNDYLARFDTGLSRIEARPVPADQIHPDTKEDLRELMRPGKKIGFRAGDLLFELEDGRISAKRLFGVHRARNATGLSRLRMFRESDGTLRMLDLIPILCNHSSGDAASSVFVVDEIDRSLHSMITKAIVEEFIRSGSPSSRNQLVFTTHDLSLMRGPLLRHDEMWRVEKNLLGESDLLDLAAFKGLRAETNIESLYRQGRFGGIPHL